MSHAIPYEKLEKRFMEELGKIGDEGLYKRGILATSSDGKVIARRMRMVADGLDIYCYADPKSRKVQQIRANSNVAVVAGFIQIEGTASLRGYPMDESNIAFVEAFKSKMPKVYENSRAHRKGLELIKVVPSKITLATLGKQSFYEILDVEKREAYRVPARDLYDHPAYYV